MEEIQIVEVPVYTTKEVTKVVDVITVVEKKVPYEYITEEIEYVDIVKDQEYTSDRVKEFTTVNTENKVIRRPVEVRKDNVTSKTIEVRSTTETPVYVDKNIEVVT